MEEIHLPAPASCAMTRSNSSSDSVTSSLTTEDILEHKEDTNPCECTAWANEKHDQYLNRLEASFIEQLHQSIDQHAWCTEQGKNGNISSVEQPANSFPDQLTDVWRKINYGKTTSVGSQDVIRSPRVKHLKRAGRPCSTRSSDPQECCKIQLEGNLSSKQKMCSYRIRRCSNDLPVNYPYHCDLVASDAEGSGQNFTDDGCGDDLRFWNKKLKTLVADTSNGIQTVPSWKLLEKGNSGEEHARLASASED